MTNYQLELIRDIAHKLVLLKEAEPQSLFDKEILETISMGLAESATHDQQLVARDLVEQLLKELL